MQGFSVNTTTNDLELDSQGNIKVVSDLEALKCRIHTALQTIAGESDDTNIGVDYYRVIFAKTSFGAKVQEFLRVIKNIDGVSDAVLYDAKYDVETKTFTYQFAIKSSFGDFIATKEI